MTRRRWIYRDGQAIEVTADVAPAARVHIIGEIDAYQSPIDGRVIESRTQRRDDLARHQCRPWEGMQQETAEAARVKAESLAASDARVNEGVARAYFQMDPTKREILRGSR